MRQAVVIVTVVALGSMPVLAGGGRARAREERREERREQVQEKRDERRDNAEAARKKADPGVNKRQRRQGSRIVGGVRSGQLTKAEVDALTARESALRTMEGEMKADGTVSKAEREALHAELTALSKDIRSEKHDADRTAPLRVRDGLEPGAAAAQARRLAEVRRSLNSGDLTPEQRSALEAEHTSLIDALYEEDIDIGG